MKNEKEKRKMIKIRKKQRKKNEILVFTNIKLNIFYYILWIIREIFDEG